MAISGGNKYLSLAQMTPNAKYIWDFFQHWTESARAGMLGNMGGPESGESTINPQIWQGLHYGSLSLGFGVSQWTPATKYLDWAKGYGFTWGNGGYNKTPEEWLNNQCLRIQWESENEKQWKQSSNYPISFKSYTQSNKSPEYQAYVWLNNYEQPRDRNQPQRKRNARYWFNLFTGSDPDSPGYDPDNPVDPPDPDEPTPPTSQTLNRPSPIGAICGYINTQKIYGRWL